MENDKPFDQASEVTVKNGVVKVAGPGSVDVALTPKAALETSDRLFGQAMKARGETLKEKAANEAATLRKPHETANEAPS